MPIFYNFYILLVTFYTIFGTNILMQVSICCMFFVSQKIHIKRSPNEIKTDGDFFGINVNFGKWNQHETMLEGPTWQGCAPGPRGHPVRWVLPLFCLKKANIRRKIMFKVSIQSKLRIFGNIRNGERPESGA